MAQVAQVVQVALGLGDLDGEVCLQGCQLLVVLVAPEGLVDPVDPSVLVGLLAFLLALGSGETMVVRHLRRLHRSCLVAEVVADRSEKVPIRSGWNYDLACWGGRSEHFALALAKQCVTGWSGFEGWQAQLGLLVEGVSC